MRTLPLAFAACLLAVPALADPSACEALAAKLDGIRARGEQPTAEQQEGLHACVSALMCDEAKNAVHSGQAAKADYATAVATVRFVVKTCGRE